MILFRGLRCAKTIIDAWIFDIYTWFFLSVWLCATFKTYNIFCQKYSDEFSSITCSVNITCITQPSSPKLWEGGPRWHTCVNCRVMFHHSIGLAEGYGQNVKSRVLNFWWTFLHNGHNLSSENQMKMPRKDRMNPLTFCFKVKCINSYWMDFHYIWYKYSCHP